MTCKAMAAIQSKYRAYPLAKPAVRMAPAARKFIGTKRATLKPTARTYMNPCTMITIKYPMPNANPASWNALGIARAQIRKADIPAISRSWRLAVTGGTLLVSQTYPPYIQNRTMKIRKDCSNRSQDKDLERSAVTWVSVKTKTRSKNSSREVTRSCSASIFGFLCALVFFAIVPKSTVFLRNRRWGPRADQVAFVNTISKSNSQFVPSMD